MLDRIKMFFKSKKQLDPSFDYSGIVKYIPLIVCGGFYFITILLFEFGPYNWHVNNKLELYSFLFLSLFVLILGYIFATERDFHKKTSKKSNRKVFQFNIDNIILISFIFYIISTICNLYASTGKIYPDVVLGFKNAALAYKISHTSLNSFSAIVYYINMILSIFTMFLIPLTLIYFKNLSKRSKIISCVVIILSICCGIAQGVINSCATFVFEIILFCLIYIFSTLKNGRKLEKVILILVMIFFIVFFFAYYKSTMSSRLISDSTGTSTSAKDSNLTSEEINDIIDSAGTFSASTLKSKYFLSFLPDSFESSVNHVISYVTHGYKGLSLAMNKKFTSSYGLGFSDFFRHNILKVLFLSKYEKKIYSRTYMYKIEKNNWKTGNVWSSFFIFPASDIGFILTIPFVGLIGFIFGLSWKDSIKSKNIFASIVFVNFCITVCFFSANNNIYQTSSFISAVLAIVLWLVFKFKSKGKVIK